ncbi:type IA DNA topoisomerase [Portibacter lacus]|uniref:DNA topoisomerase n=1 Tax=Portibacter lacus TaxID=1099794 RepID=A0AA37SYD6_9BACT|nr:type IA DNA topoisomerase [Portibacter lacus]GLR19878.1 DNA topoisomerase III [Portibacter lacus]
MKVCIAEKPSVAKEIASVIGAKTRKDGYYEGNGYQVTWTFGHFCTLLPPQDYNPHWKRWDLDTLPMLPDHFDTKLMGDSGVRKQFKVIKSLFKNASVVINCGDAGTEGELIQRWVIKEANYKGEVQRLWISSLTSEAIRKGFEDLKPASKFDNLFYAASSRAIGDWLLGMNATRLYTLKYGGHKQVLSIGRVQTPTLAMLVKRYQEIENFVPQPYWELHTDYRNVTFKNTTGRFEKVEEGQALLEQIKGKDLVITQVEKKEGKEYAPKLYDLTSLQVHCNNKYGFSADRTLKIVQKLYEMKVVSYPRVDTTYLPEDVYPKIPSILKGLTNYSQYTDEILKGKIRKSKKVFDDKKVTDHHAIIPTGEQQHLTGEQQQVYDMIARRFFAVFYPDCKVSKTTVKGKVEDVEFGASGKEILDEGWRVLFPKKDKSNNESSDDKDGDDDNVLPAFTEGEQGPHEPSLLEKMTKAPSYYTEASLLRAMETAGKQVDDDELRELMKANGIGRPSTRANIIETLFKRKYTYRRKKQVLPTEMGIQLIETIKNELLISAELTGQWEKHLKEIELGTYSPKPFIQDMKKMVDDLVTEVRMEKNVQRFKTVAPSSYAKSSGKSKAKRKPSKKAAPKAAMQCPKCTKGRVVKGKTRYGCTQYTFGCDFAIPFEIMGKTISDNQIKRLVEKGSTVKLKGFKSNEGKVDGMIIIDENKKPRFKGVGEKAKSSAASTGQANNMPACPKCKKGTLIKGNTAYGCSLWKSGCDFKFSFADIKAKAAGQKLTKDLVLKIIAS